MVDNDCPKCGAKDISPYDADDFTFLIIEKDASFAVLRSPDAAEHTPDYREVAEFSARDLAEAYVTEADG